MGADSSLHAAVLAGHAEVLTRLRKAFRPETTGGVYVVYRWVLSGAAPGTLWVGVHDGRLETGQGEASAPRADVTFRLDFDDLVGVLEGTCNPDLLFMEDRLEIDGELSIALKLRTYFRAPS